MSTNLFTQLRRLLPGQPLLIGDVLSAGGGAAVVQLPDGSQLSVRGSASVGDRVFLRGGLIEGPAPALTVVTVDI